MQDEERSARTVILGLGNPVLGDDAVGLRVAENVEELLRDRPLKDVTVATSTRAGLEVVDLLADTVHAVIVDCLAAPEPRPGRIQSLSLADCAGSARLVGAHDLTIADAFALARAVGVRMPGDVEIYGIEAAQAAEITEGLSPEVEDAARSLAERIYERLAARCGAG